MQQEPLDDLGWRGEYQWDSPEVVALRERLQQHAGIQGLEIVDPDTDPDYAARAAEQSAAPGAIYPLVSAGRDAVCGQARGAGPPAEVSKPAAKVAATAKSPR